MDRTKTLASLLSLALAASALASTPISVSLTTNVALTDTVWVSQTVPTPAQDPITYIGIGFGDMPVGTSTFEVEPIEGFILDPYTFIGKYSEDQLSVGLRADVAADAIGNAKTWDEVFVGTTEAELAGHLEVLNGLSLEDPMAFLNAALGAKEFFEDNKDLFPSFGSTATMVKFSAATDGGTIVAQPVPEPSTLALLGLGAAAFLRRRR